MGFDAWSSTRLSLRSYTAKIISKYRGNIRIDCLHNLFTKARNKFIIALVFQRRCTQNSEIQGKVSFDSFVRLSSSLTTCLYWQYLYSISTHSLNKEIRKSSFRSCLAAFPYSQRWCNASLPHCNRIGWFKRRAKFPLLHIYVHIIWWEYVARLL